MTPKEDSKLLLLSNNDKLSITIFFNLHIVIESSFGAGTWMGDRLLHWVIRAIHRWLVRILPLRNSTGVLIGKTL